MSERATEQVREMVDALYRSDSRRVLATLIRLLGDFTLAERLDADASAALGWDEEGVEDDRLRLIFTCCHPALSPDARIALTLREVCGLTTEEIARAFLAVPSTLAQRI